MSGSNLMPMHFKIAGDACDCGGFSPASLPLTGWWRADYTGAPYAGTASAGTSGSHSISTADPTPLTSRAWVTGTPVNGYIPAHSDGEMQLNIGPLEAMEMNSTVPFSDFVNATAASGWALVKPVAGGAPFTTTGGVIMRAYNRVVGNIPFELQCTGSSILMRVQGVTGPVFATTNYGSLTVDEWNLVTFRYDGISIQVGLNGAPAPTWSTAYTAPLDLSTSDPLQLGMQIFVLHLQNQAFSGDFLDSAITDTVLTDNDFCKIVCYCRDRYDLALVTP